MSRKHTHNTKPKTPMSLVRPPVEPEEVEMNESAQAEPVEAPASEKMSVETAKSWIGMAFGAITTFAVRVYSAIKWFVSALWQSLSMAVYSALSLPVMKIIFAASFIAAALFVGYVAVTMAPVVTFMGVFAAIGHVTVELALVTTTAYAGAMAAFLFAGRIYDAVTGYSLFQTARNWMTTRIMRRSSPPAAAMAA